MSYGMPAAAATPQIATAFVSAAAITPADNTPIGPYMALYVGAAGNVTLVPRNSTTPVLFSGLAAGTVLPIAFQGIQATGTTASGLLGLG